MSLRSYLLAVRNHLREELTTFYDNGSSSIQTRDRELNCRVTQDAKPTPGSGQEFIAIYGDSWRPGPVRIMQGIEERFNLSIAVTRRIADLPLDARGEAHYIRDSDKFNLSAISVEQRCREIIRLISHNYTLMQAANALFEADDGFTEPLLWLGGDAEPQLVGADHFTATYEPSGELLDDMQFGIVMKLRFGEAVRLQSLATFDEYTG